MTHGPPPRGSQFTRKMAREYDDPTLWPPLDWTEENTTCPDCRGFKYPHERICMPCRVAAMYEGPCGDEEIPL